MPDSPEPTRPRPRRKSLWAWVVDWLGAQGAGNLVIIMIAVMIIMVLLMSTNG